MSDLNISSSGNNGIYANTPEFVATDEEVRVESIPADAPIKGDKRTIDEATVAVIQTLSAQGKNASEISRAVGISYATVRKYMADLPRKPAVMKAKSGRPAAKPVIKTKPRTAPPVERARKTTVFDGRMQVTPPKQAPSAVQLGQVIAFVAVLDEFAEKFDVAFEDLPTLFEGARQIHATLRKRFVR